MSANIDFINNMKTQLKKWDDDVAVLADQAKKASSDARASYEAGLTNLQANREAAQKTFSEICAASESAASQMRASMESAWIAMQKGLESMSAQFRK